MVGFIMQNTSLGFLSTFIDLQNLLAVMSLQKRLQDKLSVSSFNILHLKQCLDSVRCICTISIGAALVGESL